MAVKREAAKRWLKNNPEKRRAIVRQYLKKNGPRINAERREKRAVSRKERDAKKREWERLNPDIVAAQRARARIRKMNVRLNSTLRFHYDITAENYAEIVALQGGVCAICQKYSPTEKSKRLFVGHCHKAGRLRALLCHHCNAGLGYFKEDERLLQRAIAYIASGSEMVDTEPWPSRVKKILKSMDSP